MTPVSCSNCFLVLPPLPMMNGISCMQEGGGVHKLGGRGANASRHTEPGEPVQMLYHTETAMSGYTNWHVATHKQQGRSFGETCTSGGGDVALVMQPFLPCCRMTAAVFSGPSQGLIKHIANRFGSFPS